MTQPSALVSHVGADGGNYMYTCPLGGTVDSMKLTVDPFSGLTNCAFRTYRTGISLTSGLGIADDIKRRPVVLRGVDNRPAKPGGVTQAWCRTPPDARARGESPLPDLP